MPDGRMAGPRLRKLNGTRASQNPSSGTLHPVGGTPHAPLPAGHCLCLTSLAKPAILPAGVGASRDRTSCQAQPFKWTREQRPFARKNEAVSHVHTAPLVCLKEWLTHHRWPTTKSLFHIIQAHEICELVFFARPPLILCHISMPYMHRYFAISVCHICVDTLP